MIGTANKLLYVVNANSLAVVSKHSKHVDTVEKSQFIIYGSSKFKSNHPDGNITYHVNCKKFNAEWYDFYILNLKTKQVQLESIAFSIVGL